MMPSLFAGVSGLQNHQTEMDVIGNNIANVDTVAFKSSSVTFKEGFAQLLQGASRPPGNQGGINPIQVGLGMQIGSIDTNMTQGNLQSTGVNTDVAINGNSFFVARQGNQSFYSRSGNFQIDAQGNLVEPDNGFIVQGKMAVERRVLRCHHRHPAPVRPEGGGEPDDARCQLAGNLDGSQPVFDTTDPAGGTARRRLQRRDDGEPGQRELVHRDDDHRVRLARHEVRPEDRPLQERVERRGTGRSIRRASPPPGVDPATISGSGTLDVQPRRFALDRPARRPSRSTLRARTP